MASPLRLSIPTNDQYSPQDPNPNRFDELILDREEYFRQKAIDAQNRIVNVKSATTITSDAFIWTYRTTNCDVVSIITTAIPIKEGHMKDINIDSHEPKRLKPPNIKKSVKDILGSTPYDVGLSVDVDKKRKKLNKMLQEERKEFMNKLNLTRFIRSKIEERSVLKIQAVYRGYYIRNNLEEIRHYCQVHQMIRANIRSYLSSESYPTDSLFEFCTKRRQFRHYAARLIQAVFKRFLSRQCCRRRRFQKRLAQRTKSAIIIQAIIRGIIARSKVRTIIEQRQVIKRLRCAIKLQAIIRRLFAKRKVDNRRFKLHTLAARMIQSWYRAKYSRRMARHIKQMLYLKRANRAATFLQKLVRSFLAKHRIYRLRLRKVWSIITIATIKIQTLIRRFLGKIYVQRKRRSLQRIREEKQRVEEEAAARERQIQEQAENQALLDSADLFLQAHKGQTRDVEDIYLGLIGGEEHTPTEVDAQGETILTISAKVGNLDLLRKCLMTWGFDINYRNREGLTAVMIAAKHQQLLAVQYLLSFHPDHPNYVDSEAFEKLIELHLSSEDIGFLFVQAVHYSHHHNADLAMIQALVALSLDINAASSSATTAIHTACELGNAELFKYLHSKLKAKIDSKDESQQLPIHKAVTSNLNIVKWILGLDPNYTSYMSNETRFETITSIDSDGKDCLLLAILSGKTEIVHLLEHLLQNQGAYLEEGAAETSFSASTSSSKGTAAKKSFKPETEEVAWSNQDILKAGELVEKSNIFCLHKLLSLYGFDVNWTEESSNRSLAMIAAWIADLDILDLLLQKQADLSLLDSNGETVLHYAVKTHPRYSLPIYHSNATTSTTTTSSLQQMSIAFYKRKEGLISFLLSHPQKTKTRLSASLLKQQTLDTQENCFHLAARNGLELNIDLLVDAETMSAIMQATNREGQTPFLLACLFYHERLIQSYLRLGSNIHHEDAQGHSGFWYLFHPHATAVLAHRRVLASEYLLQVSTSISRKERDEETAKIQNEIQLISLFLRHGCRLYTKLKTVSDHQRVVSAEKLKEDLLPRSSLSLSTGGGGEVSNYEKIYERLEPGDILLYESAYSFFRVAIPSLLSPLDAWRLLLASVRLDDGSLKMFLHLLRCGILDVLCQDPSIHLPEIGYTTVSEEGLPVSSTEAKDLLPLPAISTSLPHNNNNSNTTTAATPSHTLSRNKSHRQQSLGGQQPLHRSRSNIDNSLAASSSATAATGAAHHHPISISLDQIFRLQDLFYNHLSLIGWLIRLGHLKIFSYFLKKCSMHYNYASPVDDQYRYPLLHFLAIYGTAETLDTLLATIQSINQSIDAAMVNSSATSAAGSVSSIEAGPNTLNNNTNTNTNNTNNNNTATAGNNTGATVEISSEEVVIHYSEGVLLKRIQLRYESLNHEQQTPFMLASRAQNFSMIKKFYKLKVNLRNALSGRWNAWVLAFVLRLERNEKLTQTGRTGEDDERDFNLKSSQLIKDFPIYSFWMK